MKRFLLFGYESHYSIGGRNDVVSSFATLEEVWAEIAKTRLDHYHALDMEKREWLDLPLKT